MPRNRLWCLVCSLCVSLTVGCPGRDEGLAVTVQTDFVPVVEFDTIVTTLDDADARDVGVAPSDSFRRPRPVTTFEAAAPGRRTVRVQLLQAGRPVVSRAVTVQFRGSYLLNVVLSRSCRDVVCDDAETCVAGVCVSPRCDTGTESECPRPECSVGGDCRSATECVEPSCVAGVCLETGGSGCAGDQVCVPGLGCVARPRPIDAGAMDAGPGSDAGRDAGPRPDAGPPPDCSIDEDCDDGIACTEDRCEPDGRCLFAARDAACPESACVPGDPAADPTTGCLPACNATTCAAGPCESATCVAGRCERASTCGAGEMCCSGVCAADCGTVTCAGRPAGEVCRASTGPCDPEERCDGSPSCPPDALAASTTICRPSAGECDVAERCTTGGPSCPPNGFQPDGTACSAGSCDGLGACSSACVPGAPCTTGNPCEVGRRECPSGACVASGPAPAGTVCRASAGVCDRDEICSGTTCPADTFRAAGTECRAQRGVCDRAEVCSGSSAACPADLREPSTTVCRNEAAGGCDVAERCTGSSDDCPTNAFRSSSTICRMSAGPCDVADRCTGSSAICPADAVSSMGTVCRAALGTCDAPETCDGATVTCPAEPGRRFGDACCAGATCTESTCLNGRCAVFGGSYTYNAYDGVCGSGNPLAGNACMCPVGFTARNVEDVDYNVDEGMGWLNELHTCVVSGSPGASVDFAGAHGRITTGYPGSMGCTDSCTAPAGTTGTCTCPPGTTASTYQGIHFLSGTSMDCEREVTYCTGTAAPLSYGGSFWRHVTGRDLTCDSGLAPGARCIPNPRTGACSCPAGFIEQVSSMMQRRIIDRGSGPENWTCRGDLVVCQRLP